MRLVTQGFCIVHALQFLKSRHTLFLVKSLFITARLLLQRTGAGPHASFSSLRLIVFRCEQKDPVFAFRGAEAWF